MNDKNIPKLLKEREKDSLVNRRLQNRLQVYDNLVKRLGLETELEGHEGCVNCLEWNKSGSLLASGSDDLNAIIWDPHHRQINHKINTGHNGNIFSVKFMPNTGDHVLATGAADSQVRIHSVAAKEPIHTFKCHTTRVKRLATSADTPHLVWSASEDGTIRQFDLRDSHSCHNRGETCTNILIDLNIHIGGMCEAKCIKINPCQSELMAVGCNDPFVRLYDRRMLAKHCTSELGVIHCTTKSCQKDTATLPNNTVEYFTPGHLPGISSRAKRRSVVATYLTFGPTGRELLVNLGGEQLYLFDIRLHRSSLHYTTSSFTGDAAGPGTRNGIIHTSDVSTVSSKLSSKPAEASSVIPSAVVKTGLNGSTNGYTVTKMVSCRDHQGTSRKNGDTSHQLPAAAQHLKGRANEEFEKKNYWAAINLYNEALIVAPESAVLYANRAAAYLKRGWYGDIYAALRDCHQALKMDSTNSKASYRQARCLLELDRIPEAEACFLRFKRRFPDECSSKLVMALERDIEAKLLSETEDASSSTCADNTKKEAPRRRHSVVVNDCEKGLREGSFDYTLRFCGHCNTTTDIKEANFFGNEGEYIIAGSDDGSFFVWEKRTTNLIRILKGDDSIVNCLQPHPSACILATSGIDPVVRLWQPRAELDEDDEKGLGVPDEEFAQVAKDNQRRMKTDPFELMLLNLGYPASRMGEGGTSDDSEGESGAVPLQCHTS